MDFSWVKQLAEQSNQQESARLEKEKQDRERNRLAALATVPFVEKIYLLIGTCTEEFNKHCQYQHLRVVNGKLTKRSKTPDSMGAEPDEVAYFCFARQSYMYGIRGINGIVDFVEIPVTDPMSALGMRLDEFGAQASRSMKAELEPGTGKVVWTMNGTPMDGPAIISACQQYFSDFIARTSES